MNRFTRGAVALATACAALLGPASTAHAQARAAQAAPVQSVDVSAALESATRQAAPAVVQIFTTGYLPAAAHPKESDLVAKQRASGSGAIVDAEGYIVTNAHVVRGAQRLRVDIPDTAPSASILGTPGRTLPARVIGIDAETDLAVIKVEQQNLPTLAFGDSDELKAGQLVLALGSPMGLRNSVTLGIVSNVARQLQDDSPMVYVQTDAPINPGNSGGPLIDTRGRLMGINTLIVSSTGGNEGLGFAAPSNIVRTVYEQIRQHGRVRRGDVGLSTQTVTPVMAAGLGLGRDRGALVADVRPGSPAARAGLSPGEIVLSLDGKPMENGRQLQVGLYRRTAGEVVALEVLRDGRPVRVSLLVGERQDVDGLSTAIDPRQNMVERLGILGIALDPKIAQVVQVARVQTGVVVVATVPSALDTPADGLSPGDVIYSVNATPVNGLGELRNALGRMKSGDAVVLQLERRGALMFLPFTID